MIFVASIADAASRTRRVRVELPNTAGEPAGQEVYVSFPPAEAEPDATTDDTEEVASEEATDVVDWDAVGLGDPEHPSVELMLKAREGDHEQPNGEAVPDENED